MTCSKCQKTVAIMKLHVLSISSDFTGALVQILSIFGKKVIFCFCFFFFFGGGGSSCFKSRRPFQRALFSRKANRYSGPKVIKLFSCSTQLSMKIFSADKYENAN